MKKTPIEYSINLTVNGIQITTELIGRHYLEKHSSYKSDDLILKLVLALDGHTFLLDSVINGVEYYVAYVQLGSTKQVYRIIWLFEGDNLEILGVINAYRRSKKKE